MKPRLISNLIYGMTALGVAIGSAGCKSGGSSADVKDDDVPEAGDSGEAGASARQAFDLNDASIMWPLPASPGELRVKVNNAGLTDPISGSPTFNIDFAADAMRTCFHP